MVGLHRNQKREEQFRLLWHACHMLGSLLQKPKTPERLNPKSEPHTLGNIHLRKVVAEFTNYPGP